MNFLILVSGPSGVGKNTLISKLGKRWPFGTNVSCTSRKPKAGEVDGKHYHFLTREEFEARIARGEFAEYAEVHGNLYGTLTSTLSAGLDGGEDIIMDIDVQGAWQLKKKIPEAVTVFILPPNFGELRKRIESRNRGDTEEEVSRRLETARWEIQQAESFDYFMMNGELNEAVDEFYELVRSLHNGGVSSRIRFRNPTVLEAALAA